MLFTSILLFLLWAFARIISGRLVIDVDRPDPLIHKYVSVACGGQLHFIFIRCFDQTKT